MDEREARAADYSRRVRRYRRVVAAAWTGAGSALLLAAILVLVRKL